MALLNYSEDNIANGYYISRNWDNFDYYYVRAPFNGELEVPDDIVKNNCIIVVNFELEPYKHIVDKIYIELICRHNIDPERILLLSENPDFLPYIYSTAEKYNKKLIKYEWTSVAELSVSLQTLNDNDRFKENFTKNKIPKKIFLSFNRRWRMHRPFFVAMCVANNLLDYGYISLGVSDDYQNWNDVLPKLYDLCSPDIKLLHTLKNVESNILSLPNLYLDTENLVSPRHVLKQADIDSDLTDSFYRESLLSVVSETIFFENEGRFLSEKTFKTMSYRHPFILIGPPKSLSLLKELGYKTYHPFIDESYDNEKNPLLRMQLIIKELKRLSSLSENEILEFKKSTANIAGYNYVHLLMRKKFGVKKI